MTGAVPKKVMAAFAAQGRACQSMGSPFMAAFMSEVLDALPAGSLREKIMTWPGALGHEAASVPLRLASGFHALALLGRVGPLYLPSGNWRSTLSGRLQAVSREEEGFLLPWLDDAPQTNEVGRSAVLIAVASALSRRFGLPLRLSELGASAGLNLGFDRYGLQSGAAIIGATDSPVHLRPEWRSPSPQPHDFQILDRRGCDLNPLDPATEGLRLMAYVWPDQPERLSRLRAALTLAPGGQVDRADAALWLDDRLTHDWSDQCHLVYHTVAHQYFPPTVQDHIAQALQQAGDKATPDAPLAWFGMEADQKDEGAGLTLRLWPGDLRIDLGRAGFHGQWIDWAGL